MQSLFEEIEYLHKTPFWKKVESHRSLETDKLLYQGMLLELKSSGKTRQSFFSLTNKYLYSSKPGHLKPNKQAVIKFRVIEPFIEEREDTVKYGFQIILHKHSKIFYTSSMKELDKWMDYLAMVGIMTKIEDDYQIMKLLGKGSYANVYLARDLCTDKEYAIKSIDKSLIKSKNTFNGMVNEIDILRTLDHPNIVKIHKVYESETHIQLVLDYIKGGSLLARLHNEGPLSEKQSRKFMKKLLELLVYLEDSSIIHRDIKLENILLLSEKSTSHFKLIDFGFSGYLKDKETAYCGTPGYMAPEIIRNIPYGLKADVFSAGILLYILLYNQSPFTGDTANEVIESNKRCKIFFDSKYFLMASCEAIHTIMEMTSSSPAARLNAKELLKLRWFTKEKSNGRLKSRTHTDDIICADSDKKRKRGSMSHKTKGHELEKNYVKNRSNVKNENRARSKSLYEIKDEGS
ncbi:unnamed protein product [Blepharisma stoltei]|uniref:Serine/threonine protein kinase n=1 Tax=Blepharisma stoltei TaxID=1481888 RepID=A0AAU9J1N1_9CILI|nr:unnamed protein product [Blepharisma stoltei]